MRENFTRPGILLLPEPGFTGGFAIFLFGITSAKGFSVINIDSACDLDRVGKLSLERTKPNNLVNV